MKNKKKNKTAENVFTTSAYPYYLHVILIGITQKSIE